MVTGGCGFIGSHLVRRLLADGVGRVVVVDSLRYGDAGNLGADAADSRLTVVRHVIGSDPREPLATALTGVDWLFHLAAEKHNQSADDPDRVLAANVLGTRLLFELAAEAGVRKTVFTSSLYAYGRLAGPPMIETEVPLPTTVYGISKLCGERLLAHAASQSAMRGDSLRYLFVYGPRQLAGMGYKSVVVRNFERLARGEAPVIFGDGAQALDYVFVDDVVEATIRCMEHPGSGALLNVSSGQGTTINELTRLMCEVAGASVAPVHAPPDWTAGSSRVGDNARIAATLDWRPETSLRDGLARTWEWVRERRAA
jgi:UDP-glucose 4-epimerase